MSSNGTQYYAICETRGGWIGILGSSEGISRTTLPQKSQEQAAFSLGVSVEQATYSTDYFGALIQDLKSYFEGRRIVFQEKLDISRATQFEQAVWKTTAGIPYGQRQSYGWVARQIGKPLAPRAVGQALGKNPLPIIIPCHRVIASNGSLGGFGGRLDLKQYLLDLESA